MPPATKAALHLQGLLIFSLVLLAGCRWNWDQFVGDERFTCTEAEGGGTLELGETSCPPLAGVFWIQEVTRGPIGVIASTSVECCGAWIEAWWTLETERELWDIFERPRYENPPNGAGACEAFREVATRMATAAQVLYPPGSCTLQLFLDGVEATTYGLGPEWTGEHYLGGELVVGGSVTLTEALANLENCEGVESLDDFMRRQEEVFMAVDRMRDGLRWPMEEALVTISEPGPTLRGDVTVFEAMDGEHRQTIELTLTAPVCTYRQ